MVPKLSPSAYLSLIAVFLLPFMDLSCDGDRIVSLNGYEVSFGTEITVGSFFDGYSTERVEGNLAVAIAFFMALAAAAVSLKSQLSGAVIAAISFVLLLIARAEIQDAIWEEGEGLLMVSFQIGYYLSLAFLGMGCVLGVIASRQKRDQRKTGEVIESDKL